MTFCKDQLSTTYRVEYLTEFEIPQVLRLCQGNPLYYEFCPPMVSIDGIKEDMMALPPGTTEDDKYYVGYYENDTLVAVLDLILGYPNRETTYIGFFMMNKDMQGKGVGSKMISELCACLDNQFDCVRLGYMKGNPQSEAFWKKNNFLPTGEVKPRNDGEVVLMQRSLKG